MSELNDWADRASRNYWGNCSSCRQSKDLVRGPDRRRSKWLLGRNRVAVRVPVRVVTGHYELKRHPALMVVEEISQCPGCGRNEETFFHLQGECEIYISLRLLMFGTEILRRGETQSRICW